MRSSNFIKPTRCSSTADAKSWTNSTKCLVENNSNNNKSIKQDVTNNTCICEKNTPSVASLTMFGIALSDSPEMVSTYWGVLKNSADRSFVCASWNYSVNVDASLTRLSLCSNKVLVCTDGDLKVVKTVSNLNQVKLVREEVSHYTTCLCKEIVEHKKR